jgi:signal transduction histidine kinase
MVQAAVGSGIWFLVPEATTLMKLSMTAAICFYGIGIILALSNDYRVYLYSSTLLFMQPLVYWLFQGIEFYWVSLTIIFVVFVGLTIVRTISKNFAESISIRFEQNGLMANLVHARTETLFALQKAEKAIMDKAFYLASASHDLRQPLFAVNMINETLQLHELPDSALRLLKIQSQSIDAMNNMFNNLLDISQFESKKITIVRKDFDINDLQLSMADEFSTIAAKKGLQFRFEIPQVAVHSDFDLVGRVLRNLISNAICHTTTGEVVVSGEVLNQELVIAVHDTGQGIDEADHERIFDPFVQLNPAPGTGKTSIGVGLSIVKHISELLDLRLQLKSKPEMGTTMSFYLPIAS